jgi:hypothetical protein
MSQIDFKGLHQGILYWLGKRSEKVLCGNFADQQQVDSDHPNLYGHLFSALYDGYAGSYRRVVGSLRADGRDQILLALLLIHGVSPSWILREYRSDTRKLTGQFLNALDYFKVKALMPNEDVKSLLKAALQKLTADDYFNYGNHHQEVGEIVLCRVTQGVWFNPGYEFLDPFVDIQANSATILGCAQKYLEWERAKDDVKRASQEIEGNAWRRSDRSIFNELFRVQNEQLIQAWHIMGQDFDSIFAAIDQRMAVQVELGLIPDNDSIVDNLKQIKKAFLLGGYPIEQKKYGVRVSDFLGMHLLEEAERERLEGKDCDSNLHYYHRPLICRYSESTYSKKVLKQLESQYPDIYTPQNCAYNGSRCIDWCNKIASLEPIADLLNEMKSMGIWHPLLNRKDFTKLANQDVSNKIIKEFLEEGAKWRMKQAESIIAEGKVDFMAIIPTLTKLKHFKNLAKVHIPTAEEFALIPQKFRKDFLRTQLDI